MDAALPTDTNPETFDKHDDREPDRGPEEKVKPPAPDGSEFRFGAKLACKVAGLEAEAWGASLPDCRLHLLDLLQFIKNNFKPTSNGEYR